MAIDEEEQGGGIPEWVVTFGDMMSLLLTFFILLVSLSEVKDEENYQAMVDAVRKQFGYDSATMSMAPGKDRPRNSRIASLATLGRAKKKDSHRGGAPVKAPVGDHPRVVIVRPGSIAAVGTVLFFEETSAEINDAHRERLRQEIQMIRGKPQRIRVAGHTSSRLPAGETTDDALYQLAYQRCINTRRVLIEEFQIDPQRIALHVAGATEPEHIGSDPLEMKKNSRVEIFLLDQVVDELQGTANERRQREVAAGGPSPLADSNDNDPDKAGNDKP